MEFSKTSRILLVALLLISHPLSSTVSSESAKTSDHILWLRTPGDGTIHYITSVGEIEIHDQYNGSLIFKKSIRHTSQILQEDLLVWGESEWFRQASLGLLPTSFWGYPEGWDGHGRPADGPSIIINGDYSGSGESLFLNICKVDFVGYQLQTDRGRAKLLLCEFIDFNSNYNVTRYSTSETEYAVTYPTETGTFRVYSNHSIEDPERWQFGSMPWISSDPDDSQGSHTILPYPLSNGTTWLSTNMCYGPRVSQQIYELNRTNLSLRFEAVAGVSTDCRYASYADGDHVGHHLSDTNQQIYAGDGCWMQTPDMTDIMRTNFGEIEDGEYAHTPLDFNNISSIPISWFHIRLPQNSFVRGVDIPETYWISHPDPIHTSPEGYGIEHRLCAFNYDLDAYNPDDVYGELAQGYGFYNTFDIDHDNGVVYNVDCDWQERHRGRTLGDGCKEIYTHPDDVWYLNWPSKFPTVHSTGMDWSFAPFLLIFLIFGLAVTTSRKSNDILAKFVGKAAKSVKLKGDLGGKIRNLHYDNWEKGKLDLASDTVAIGGGGIAALFAGIVMLAAYSVYAMLAVMYYLVIAYLVIAGTALLALGYVVGLICFLPLLLLGAFAG